MTNQSFFGYSTIHRNSVSLYQGPSCLPMESHHKRAELQQIVQKNLQDLLHSNAFTSKQGEIPLSATRFTLALSTTKIDIQLFDHQGNQVAAVISIRLDGEDEISQRAAHLLNEVNALYDTPPLPDPVGIPPSTQEPREQVLVATAPPNAELLQERAGNFQDPPANAPPTASEVRATATTDPTNLLIELLKEQQRDFIHLVEQTLARLDRNELERAAQQTHTIDLLHTAHREVTCQLQLQLDQLRDQLRRLSEQNHQVEPNAALEQLIAHQQRTLEDLSHQLSARSDRADTHAQRMFEEVMQTHRTDLAMMQEQMTALQRQPAPREPAPFNISPIIEAMASLQTTFTASIERLFSQMPTNRNEIDPKEFAAIREQIDSIQRQPNSVDITPITDAMARQQATFSDSLAQLFHRIQSMSAETQSQHYEQMITQLENSRKDSFSLIHSFMSQQDGVQSERMGRCLKEIEQLHASYRQELDHLHAHIAELIARLHPPVQDSPRRVPFLFPQSAEATTSRTPRTPLASARSTQTAALPTQDAQTEQDPPNNDGAPASQERGTQNTNTDTGGSDGGQTPFSNETGMQTFQRGVNDTVGLLGQIAGQIQTNENTVIDSSEHEQALTQLDNLLAYLEYALQAGTKSIKCEHLNQAFLTNFEDLSKLQDALKSAQEAIEIAKAKLPQNQTQQPLQRADTAIPADLQSHSEPLARTQSATPLSARKKTPSTPSVLPDTPAIRKAKNNLQTTLLPNRQKALDQLIEHCQKQQVIQKIICTKTRPCYANKRKIQEFTIQILNTLGKRPGQTALVPLIQSLRCDQGLFAENPEATFNRQGISPKGNRLLAIDWELKNLREQLMQIQRTEDPANHRAQALSLLSRFILNAEHSTAIQSAAHMYAAICFLSKGASSQDQKLIQEESQNARALVIVLRDLLQGFNRAISGQTTPSAAATSARKKPTARRLEEDFQRGERSPSKDRTPPTDADL